MYKSYPSWITAFHGCDRSVFEEVLYKHSCLKSSENDYDWLGSGIYFWENNPLRAYEFAMENMKRGNRVKEPAVIGAMINLGNCLDLTDMTSIYFLQSVYPKFVDSCQKAGVSIPENSGKTDDKVFRHLDCAIIQFAHAWIKRTGGLPYDSVRGAFIEGNPLFADSAFRKKSHIQLSIRNTDCIKGFFAPRIDVKATYENLAHGYI